jgi:hypothetical protein
MVMNSPPVTPFAPSPHPALELIALAQLSPEVARQKLRALLLGNPNYFGKVPLTTLNAVLKIQEDTTYECISRVGYDAEFEQLRATVAIKKLFGYSSDTLINGSEEFVRFYLSYDGGTKWLDQGMRSVNVVDAHLPRPLAHEVTLPILVAKDLYSAKIPPKVRAILSWNSLPPAGAPNWSPLWGNVLESDIQIEDSQVVITNTLRAARKTEIPNRGLEAMGTGLAVRADAPKRDEHLPIHTLASTKTDPQHRFLAYVLARAAGKRSLGSWGSQFKLVDPIDQNGLAPAFPPVAVERILVW